MKGENIIVVFQFYIQNVFDYVYEILRLYNLPFSVMVKTVFLQNALLQELLICKVIDRRWIRKLLEIWGVSFLETL
jgi:hypothetical protein